MRELTSTELANVLNIKTVAAWSEEDALNYLDEFGLAKSEAGLELMQAGMDPGDVVNTLRMDTSNQLLNPLVQSIVLAGYQRMQEDKLTDVVQSLARVDQRRWEKRV